MFVLLRAGYVTLLAIAVIEVCAALYLGQSTLAVAFRLQGLKTMLVAIGALFPLIWIAGVTLSIVRRQIDRPTATLIRMITSHRYWLLRGALFAILLLILARSFSSYKSSISRFVPFWSDPWLVQLDYMTFGTDPWTITHAFIGPIGTLVLDRIYILWFFMMFLLMGWICFTKNAKLQVRGIMSYMLSWGLLGSLFATVTSSVGPCFYQEYYGDARFSPLMAKLEAVHAQYPLFAFRSMDFLRDSLGQDRMGSGISAMPSLHVAVAMLCFLATLSYSRSWALKTLAGVFAGLILVGSVHLGWHYAWDGFAGIFGVMLIWWATGRFVDWLEARELGQRAPAPALKPLRATA